MRILFVTVPFRAHLYGQVPLAWALRTAGHEVCVAGPPDIAEDIARAGLSGVAVGEPVLRQQMAQVPVEAPMRRGQAAPAGEEPGPCDPRGRRTGRSVQSDFGWGDPYVELQDVVAGVSMAFFSESTFDDLVGFARTWRPDLVITDISAFPGAVAAHAVGAAHARLALSVDRMTQLRSACRARLESDGDPLRDWLEPILGRYGGDFDETTVTGHWTITATPPWIWQPEGLHHLPMRNIPFNGPATAPRWVYEPLTRRRVCLSQGISHRDAAIGGGSSSRRLLDAVADLDVEVIATLNADQLGSVTLPDNVRAVDFVPFTALLPTCAAIVHEGGAGTFTTALEHAVPQVVVPGDFKTEKWWAPVVIAQGLEDRGAGVYAGNAGTFTPDLLRDSLKRVLEDPSYARNAARLRTETRGMPSPNDVVPALEKLTNEYRK
ncbi:nucleotide disphospho-sugar-binding domain-containing protein [Microbispora siamensis]